ncbi:MAG: MFS transporter [Rhodospirillales bacterium]|nr:MAG: MFS transporter [Rhodospirillales bacterium]
MAAAVLEAVLHNHQAFDAALASHPDQARLAPRDRAFAFTLVATSLRRLGEIDALIQQCLRRPLPDRDRRVMTLLRIGVTQLCHLGTPPHAAVDTTVNLARHWRLGRHLALINAVLRRLGRDGAALATGFDAPRMNTPDWLWRSWEAAYGPDVCRRIAEMHLREPPLDLTAKADAAAVAAAVDGMLLPTGTVRVHRHGTIPETEGFGAGTWWVQDAAAALPVRLLGDVRDRHVIDLCAAPGGKTAQLAAAGARVTAVDRSAARMALVHQNLNRLGLSADTVVADAETWRPSMLADAVLVDVPCSATGTIRRHPDVARIKQPGDVATLVALQARLLAAAVAMVRPGGLVVYCACSLQPQEGPDLMSAQLSRLPELAPEPISPAEIPGLPEAVTADGALRTLPCFLSERGGMDGFYACRLRRRDDSAGDCGEAPVAS